MEPRVIPQIGGSFAPPLSDDKIKSYKELIDKLPASQLKEVLTGLYTCCTTWWGLPDPIGTATVKHPSGRGTMVRLDESHAILLDDHIPWENEIRMIEKIIDDIDPVTEKPLRDAAHHLLWHVKELNLGREPITSDKL